MIAIKVPSVQDVNDIYAELTSRGVECIGEPRDFEFGARASYYLITRAMSGKCLPGLREATVQDFSSNRRCRMPRFTVIVP